jgi:hypothetical protein
VLVPDVIVTSPPVFNNALVKPADNTNAPPAPDVPEPTVM